MRRITLDQEPGFKYFTTCLFIIHLVTISRENLPDINLHGGLHEDTSH